MKLFHSVNIKYLSDKENSHYKKNKQKKNKKTKRICITPDMHKPTKINPEISNFRRRYPPTGLSEAKFLNKESKIWTTQPYSIETIVYTMVIGERDGWIQKLNHSTLHQILRRITS